MTKKFLRNVSVFAVMALFAAGATAQDTKKEVVVNSDGSYTVIEYPVDKEVM